MTKSFVLDASRESLLIYWLHLLVIYSSTFGKSLANYLGPNLKLIECIGVTLVLMVLMILVAKLWVWTKMKFPKYATKTAWAIVGILFMIFLFG
ncbi:MAG: hypothetical protein IT277_13630 [Ignavibacteriaceae bacterium]|nr:hypothetical protein [Ignavibacteriaceae bacterium]